jgi:hypothetical protein
MDWIDSVLLTTASTVACMMFPRLLSHILNPKAKGTKLVKATSTSQKARYEITTFPYCTSYALTGSPSCKFSPHFCSKCSANG